MPPFLFQITQNKPLHAGKKKAKKSIYANYFHEKKYFSSRK